MQLSQHISLYMRDNLESSHRAGQAGYLSERTLMYLMGHANTGCLNDDSVPLSYVFVLKCSTSSSSHDFAKACYQIFIPNLLCHLLSYSMLRAFYLAQSRAQTGFEVDHISPFRTLVQQQLQQMTLHKSHAFRLHHHTGMTAFSSQPSQIQAGLAAPLIFVHTIGCGNSFPYSQHYKGNTSPAHGCQG